MARPVRRGGSRKYLLASLDQSLRRMGLDYVDIFYSHRFDPETPLEETMGALETAVRQGKALYAGISSYSPSGPREAAAILPRARHAAADPPAVVLDAQPVDREGCSTSSARRGSVASCSPRWPRECSRTDTSRRPGGLACRRGGSLRPPAREENLAKVRALNEIATRRGQTLAQMAIAWTLRDPRVTSALIGASSVAQLENKWPPWPTSTSRPTSWPRSTATPPTPASTSGRSRAH